MADRSMIFPPPAWDSYLLYRVEIENILDPRCYSIGWLDTQILNGGALAFGNDAAVIVIEQRSYPSGATEIHGLVAAGDMTAILSLIEQAESFGRGQGFTFATIASREGWGRVLKGRGYAMHQTELRKELHHGAQ